MLIASNAWLVVKADACYSILIVALSGGLDNVPQLDATVGGYEDKASALGSPALAITGKEHYWAKGKKGSLSVRLTES